MRVSISVFSRWIGLFCLVAALAAQQMALAGEPAGVAGVDTSTAAKTSAQPESPAGDSAAAGNSSGTSGAEASVPRLIKFNGILQNLAGKSIAGPVDVTFSLYAFESGGAPLWFETQTVQADSLGQYTALLGAMSPAGIPLQLFSSGEAHWLGVQVANLPEQSRVLLVSVPYALKSGDAETLGGKPASAFMLASQAGSSAATGAAATTGVFGQTKSGGASTTPGSQTPITQAFTQNYIPVFSDNLGNLTNSIMTQSGSRIGINTNAPAFGLDVNSNIFGIGPKAALPGGGGTMRFRDDTGTVRWLFGIPGVSGSQDFFMYNYTNGHSPLYIENGAPSYSFYFSGSGNVGIGTNSPTFSLDINRSFVAIGPKAASTGVGGSVRLRNDAGTVQWSLGIPNIASSTNFFLYNNVSGQQPIYVSSGALSNSLYLTSTGVGVGTAAPTQKLDVVGGFHASGVISGDGSGLTNIGPGSIKTGLSYNINVTNALGATSTFATHVIGDFPLLATQNTFTETQTINPGNLAVLDGAISVAGTTADQVLSATQNGAGSVAVFDNTLGGKILSGRNNGTEKISIDANGNVTTAGAFTGDGSGLTNIGPSSLKSGLYSFDISGNAATASSASSAAFASNADFATNAGGAGTFAGHQLVDFPLLGQANVYSFTQTVDTGDFNVNSGKVSVGAGDLLLGTGKIGVGTSTPGKSLDVVGDMRTSTCIIVGATTIGTCSSDARFKTNVRPFTNVLDKVANLQAVRFNWRVKEFPDYHFSPGEGYGLIAQKVEKVFPDMVSTDEHGYKKVNYNQLPYLMLESIRELKERNDHLRDTVLSQQNQLEQTHAAIAMLGKANAEKDAKINSLQSQIMKLRKSQSELASLEKRLVVLEAKAELKSDGKRVASTSARRTRKRTPPEVAQAGF